MTRVQARHFALLSDQSGTKAPLWTANSEDLVARLGDPHWIGAQLNPAPTLFSVSEGSDEKENVLFTPANFNAIAHSLELPLSEEFVVIPLVLHDDGSVIVTNNQQLPHILVQDGRIPVEAAYDLAAQWIDADLCLGFHLWHTVIALHPDKQSLVRKFLFRVSGSETSQLKSSRRQLTELTTGTDGCIAQELVRYLKCMY